MIQAGERWLSMPSAGKKRNIYIIILLSFLWLHSNLLSTAELAISLLHCVKSNIYAKEIDFSSVTAKETDFPSVLT